MYIQALALIDVIAIFNPSMASEINCFSTVEPMIETGMETIWKSDYNFTFHLRNLKCHKIHENLNKLHANKS